MRLMFPFPEGNRNIRAVLWGFHSIGLRAEPLAMAWVATTPTKPARERKRERKRKRGGADASFVSMQGRAVCKAGRATAPLDSPAPE